MKQNKIKVLLVVPDFFTAIGILAQYIVSACDEIDFYFFYEGGIHRQKDDFLKLVKHIDILHFVSNIFSLELPAEIDISAIPCPKVATIHHIEPGEDEKVHKAETADVIHVTANEWETLVKEKTKKTVCLAHQPTDLKIFSRNKKVNRPRKPFKIGWFGLSGSLDNRKRLDVFLDALLHLRSQNIPFELIVRGSIWNDLVTTYREKGIKVRNLGYVSTENIWRGYSEIDLYVCTSDIEGGPLTLLEALASGVPVISTPVGQAPEVLALGGGLLVEKGNPTAVATAIKDIILDTVLYERLCKETITVLKEFLGGKITREYISMYQEAIHTYERANNLKWVSPEPFQIAPNRQRERELAYSILREAQLQKRKGSFIQSWVSVFRAVINTKITIKDKTRAVVRQFQ